MKWNYKAPEFAYKDTELEGDSALNVDCNAGMSYLDVLQLTTEDNEIRRSSRAKASREGRRRTTH